MRVLLTLAFAACVSLTAQAVTTTVNWQDAVADQPTLSELGFADAELTTNDFLALTPKKVREMTGQRLGVKGTLALKSAQKQLKRQMKKGRAADIPKGLYIVGALLGFSWLLMGLMDDFSGNNWWVNLILLILCFLPGLIHAFIKMKDYY